jgi:hypothetical protein
MISTLLLASTLVLGQLQDSLPPPQVLVVREPAPLIVLPNPYGTFSTTAEVAYFTLSPSQQWVVWGYPAAVPIPRGGPFRHRPGWRPSR